MFAGETSVSNVVLFYIFNPTLGRKEGEEYKKLLYYHPSADHMDVQTRNIGFCEAVVRFSSLFYAEAPKQHSSSMEGQLQVYYEPEKDFIMGAGVDTTKSPKLHLSVYNSMLCFAYKMFRLFFGTFSEACADRDFNRLRKRLDFFYSRYVGGMNVSATPLLDVFNGIYFTPLDKLNYLKIQTFVGRLQETFPGVKHTVFLFNGKLLWYSIPRDDMCVLFRYLANNLLPAFTRQELQPSTAKGSVHHFGKFVTGPPDLTDPSNLGKVPSIYVRKEPNHLSPGGSFSEKDEEALDLEKYHLVIYRSLNATFCLLVEEEATLDFDFYKSIDLFLGPLLGNVTDGISDVINGKLNGDGQSQYDYVYYNGDTRSIRSTFDVHLDELGTGSAEVQHSTSNSVITMEQFYLLCELDEELSTAAHSGDIMVKTDGQLWIGCHKSGQRRLFVFCRQPNANLTDVSEELKRVCSNHFNNMFTID